MNAVVIEHVKVSELPEAWRTRLAVPDTAQVTVHIEEESPTENPLFGMWKDREDLADMDAYLREIRASHC